MDGMIQEELNTLVAHITKTIEVTAIYLFGSYAYGTPNEDSDFDIYVVIPDDSLRPLEATQKIRMAMCRNQKRSVDLLVGKESTFSLKKSQPTIEKEIAVKGVIIYERPGYSQALA